jgi:glycerophosphoryl diester phosphodiesterase
VIPAVVAHRGASALRAEHTLAAYAMAIEDGADGLECDVRMTRDGHLVCVHDRRVDRTSSGRGAVSRLSLSELSTLDFGAWHDAPPESADELIRQRVATPSAGVSERGLLTLDALLQLTLDAPRPVTLFVETKHPVRASGMVEGALLATLSRYGMLAPPSKVDSRVVVMSFSSLALRRVRAQAPRLPTVLLLDRLPAFLRSGWLPGWVDWTGPGIHLLRADPGYAARAAARGHLTYCWTVDDPADVALCVRAGVRWIATNVPGAVRALL